MPEPLAKRFALPQLAHNPSGWGPPSLPKDSKEVPYAPFSKGDRLGKVADWSAPENSQNTNTTQTTNTRSGRFRSQAGAESYGSGTADRFSYTHAADEEASFSVVDRAAAPVKPRQYGQSRSNRGRGGQSYTQAQNSRGQQQRGGASQRGGFANRPGAGRGGNFGTRWGYDNKPQRLRDASIMVQPEWRIVEEIEFQRLSKLNCEVDEPVDLAFHGSLNYLNRDYDKVSVKHDKPLQQFDRTFHYASTMEDPIMHKLSKKISGPALFITSSILSTMMCTTRSVYPWDLVITKEGDRVYVDKRPDSLFDFVAVNENSAEPPVEGTDKDTINSPAMLAQEATYINRNFSQQILKESETLEFEKPNPFYDPSQDPAPPAPVLYRYRQFELDDIAVVVRTQLDVAVHQPKNAAVAKTDRSSFAEAVEDSSFPFNDTLFATVHALNEFDPRAVGAGGAPDWRQKLDMQRGAVMATELKNNGNKLAKWSVEAILAGAEQIRIGYVSRSSFKERTRHTILGVGFFKPNDFATQMNYNLKNGWGIVKALVDLCRGMEDGKFALVRDPNKQIIRLYQLPSENFDDEFGEGEYGEGFADE